jgi:hypothetical protein
LAACDLKLPALCLNNMASFLFFILHFLRQRIYDFVWLLATGFPIDIVESESLKTQLGEALLEPRDPEPSTKY